EVKSGAIGGVSSLVNCVAIIVVINRAKRNKRIIGKKGIAGVVFAAGQQPVVQFGIEIHTLFPGYFGSKGHAQEGAIGVALVTARLTQFASRQGIGQAGGREGAEIVNDVVELGRVVA